ncbi:PD-(D/E)XK nuclease family protein [Gloeocapsa sp. PCC 73106]|uniref:PD-(D/E)XK nuclease family protein n=1 Tax=Gloeocapsa sp. PCC 73106 TaxID=102232 RepID=UPI0002AC0045|nr:PD-(D/E)XK nuclease family protein [Gloeocapsa sp. PCC 73106]ELS00191.1 hypothetical protein GLO73106DRAFT_00040470 [Gloeocapsa sp. PCC 73106]
MIDSAWQRLSQGQLNLLATCPPMFQRNYLEQLTLPISPEQTERVNWGNRFHLLMQQRELNLPIEPFLAEDPEMERSLTALIQAAPELFQDHSYTWRGAEHPRTLAYQGYLFTVIYDLLLLNPKSAQIIDWKTYLKPKNRAELAANWQTRLYLYVLAETSAYLPPEISLTYWFVQLPHQPQSLTFNYNLDQHQRTEQDLTRLLTQLNQWLEAYEQRKIPFPHRLDCQYDCPYYSFLLEGNQPTQSQNWQQLLSEIDEISLE